MIVRAGLPPEVRDAIELSYGELCTAAAADSKDTTNQRGGADTVPDVAVAVRSSATAEDLPTASFAGQQASFLNVVGADRVADAVLECLASVFTDRAIAYRVYNGFEHMQVKGAVAVQLMVRSDKASSGVAFTLDPDTGFRDVVVITGSYGLGESVVAGRVDPDEVQVFKPSLKRKDKAATAIVAEDPIIRRRVGAKQTKMVYTRRTGEAGQTTKTVPTPKEDRIRRSFSDEDSKILAQWCVDIEEHYSQHHGQETPMDIEWAKDGETGLLYIVQARPETVRSRQTEGSLKQTIVKEHGNTVLEGTAIGSDAASGKVRVIKDLTEMSKIRPGEILVADMTDPDW
jgi:pyruvate,water dikinase